MEIQSSGCERQMMASSKPLAGSLWVQEKEKTFGQRLVDIVAAKHRLEVIYLGLHA
jgi:hypothetical protein